MVTRDPEKPFCLVIYLYDLTGGGAERLYIRLAVEFVKLGWNVIFLLDLRIGELVSHVPDGCEIEVLGAKLFKALPRLVRFLQRVQPDVLIANFEDLLISSLVARRLARVPTRMIVVQHSTFTEEVKGLVWQYRIFAPLYRWALPYADAVVAVSGGVADDLTAYTGLARRAMTIIHTGVVTDDFERLASTEPAHPWFAENRPVILGIGRMAPQKDFKTLIAAFASIQDSSDARLMILGDGPMREELELFVESFGLADRVALPGFIDNPLPYLSRAKLFVLSSRFEGCPTVVIEALACGIPVVSTDCPHGPLEILDGGRYGDLVPVGDPAALGKAMLSALKSSANREELKSRGRVFSVATCAAAYATLIRQLMQSPAENTRTRRAGVSSPVDKG